MRFSEPLWLLIFFPVLAGLGYSWRHLTGMPKGRKRVSLLLRAVFAALLIMVLAGPESYRENEGTCTIFVLDRSDSISGEDSRRAESFMQEAVAAMRPEDQYAIIAFGRTPVLDTAPSGKSTIPPILSKTEGGASDLASAIRLASATFPEGKAKRIVVLTDGNETQGDAVEPAQVAAQDDVNLDVVVLGAKRTDGEVAVLELNAPTETRIGQKFELRAVVHSSKAMPATLELDRNGGSVSRIPVNLQEGRNSVLIPEELDSTGLQRYRVRVIARDDKDIRNNIGMGFVQVRGRPTVLVMQDDLSKTELTRALTQSGLQVELRGPGALPVRPEQYQRYDAVIFNDFNARNVFPAQEKMLIGAVRDGGVGFAMIGGEGSYLPGGYYGTQIAEMLPVDLNIRQRKSFPSTSVAILVDCSGSMGAIEDGVKKLDMAIRAAQETIKLLAPFDKVAVAGSSDGVEWVAPLQILTDKMAVVNQARRLEVSGGGIYIGPTVEAAEKVLRKSDSKVRHVIILADGADSTDFGDAISRTSNMRADRITTTVVAIGDGSDVPELRRLAIAGGGNFYLATRASQLPAIFTQDTAIMSRSAIEEGTFVPKMVGSDEVMRGISATPALHAYCLADARPLARVVLKTAKDDPLLAKWQFGLGTTMAFTSDAQARWGRDWVAWEGFGAFWGQFARALSRKVSENRYQVNVENVNGKGEIEVTGVDSLGNPLSGEELTVRVLSPSGDSQELRLKTSAPGTFQASFKAEETGSYIVSVAEPGPDGKPLVSTSGFAVAYPPEYRTSGPNEPLLNRLAQTAGGKLLTVPADAYRPLANVGGSVQEIWPFLLWISCGLWILDIAVRRVSIPWADIAAWVRSRRREPVPVAATANAVRLSAAKQRVSPGSGGKVQTPVPRETPTETSSAPAPSPPASTRGAAAASRLLDAKRRRNQEDDNS